MKETWAACAGGSSVTDSQVAARFPSPVSQARPRRPRPAVCRAAAIQSGPRAPASARRRASALVESISSRNSSGGTASGGYRSRAAAAACASGSSAISAHITTGKANSAEA